MKKLFVLLTALFTLTQVNAQEKNVIRIATDNTDLILGAGARIYFPSTGRYTAVTSSFHVWRKVVDVFLVQ